MTQTALMVIVSVAFVVIMNVVHQRDTLFSFYLCGSSRLISTSFNRAMLTISDDNSKLDKSVEEIVSKLINI